MIFFYVFMKILHTLARTSKIPGRETRGEWQKKVEADAQILLYL